MTASFPYTHISCPCSSQALDTEAFLTDRRASYFPQVKQEDEDGEDKPLNPHDPRSNYSLYPYDHLLFCDECHQVRCPKCWTEEITNWYCPNCLFEVPSSLIKTDGNRCTRSCYNCPLCTAPLSVSALDNQSKDHLRPVESQQPGGPFILACSYCDWSSLDLGIEFSKPNKITEQLGRHKRKANASVESRSEGSDERSPSSSKDAMFTNLTKFYQEQLQESDPSSSNPFGDSSYNSPRSLTRIMQLYGGLSAAALKKSQEKPQPMREALEPSEGLDLINTEDDRRNVFRLQSDSSDTSTISQRLSHSWNYDAPLHDDLWPVPTLLRTRRSKRCSQCRHILIRLEDRKTSSSSGSTTMKYKIRLLAQNHIPRLSLRQFSPGISASAANPSPSSALTPAALRANTESKDWDLMPGRTIQYLLTLTNPLFEPVKVTLASPTTTPGRVQSRVTILCPTFEIGADGDMWDEALSAGAAGGSRSRATATGPRKDQVAGEDRQPEAGKVWETGRNWTSVVVEVVPGSVSQVTSFGLSDLSLAQKDTTANRQEHDGKKYDGLREGEDTLEIPILVRVEWQADVAAEEGGVTSGAKPARENRELAFWSVLGAGRIVT